MTGCITSSEQTFLRATSHGSNSYGLMFRKDSSGFYILLTDKGNTNGDWNDYRPFYIDLATGKCTIDGNASTATALSSEISNDKLPARLRENTSGTSANPDTFMSSGFYYAGSAGISNVNDANILTIAHTKNSWCHQLGFKFNGGGVSGNSYDGADVYTRIYNSTNNDWSNWHALLSSGNYTAYTVTKTGTGASGTWGINITGNANTANYLNVIASNEIRFNNFNDSSLWFNYMKPDGTATTVACTDYFFGNGQRTSAGVGLHAGSIYLSNNSRSVILGPNEVSSYGNSCLAGTGKGGYYGIHLGDSVNYMTVMSGVTHQGLFNEANSNWIIYYNRET